MNKKISLGAAIFLMLIFMAATVSMTMIYSQRDFNRKVRDLKDRESRYSKIAEIDNYVQNRYIGTIVADDLTDATAAGFLAGIGDPYARYYDKTSYDRLLADYSGNSVQIGIVPQKDESGYIKVGEVYPDSPAQAAGIQPDDLIVKIDDTDISSENYSEAVAMLKGEPGTKMNIVVRRGVEENTLEMTRRFVETPSVNATMLENNIGLVKFTEFNDTTPDQFNKRVNKLMDEGAQALIFDVRGVSTGVLRSVAQVLDKLLPEGTIVSSTDKDGNTTVLETSDVTEIALPMSVMMNDKTSGEAELFAQAIKDYDKGKLVGTKTAGKGTAQTIIPLTDGSAIKLTTARYNPPVSPSYDGVGVKPDFEVKMSDEQLQYATDDPETDAQLKKAIEVVAAAIKQFNASQAESSESSEETSSK
ncbi:MAG: PDZ domain-containing protein [Ruminococcaceae bacterium]|jgi:carboxyl-terminal processing protease|nr:PDZ domain-containing protein [Oscillospiraceae bacterium]